MNRRPVLHISLFVMLFFPAIFIYAQMPDWKFFRDREGNTYYYDRAMKIRIADEKPFDFTPVSEKGNDYYLHKGIDLVKSGRYSEGLFYLKSLKTLPMDNLRIENNAKEASKWINFLQKKHGTRYETFDKESTLLLNFSEGRHTLINEKLRYKIVLNRKPHILKAGWKYNDQQYGLKFGFNIEDQPAGKSTANGAAGNTDKEKSDDEKFKEALSGEDNSNNGYDCVVGIESRILKGKVDSISDAEDYWRHTLGMDNLSREEVLRKKDRIIYLYTYGGGIPFSGIEGIFINRNTIHILRVFCSSGVKDRVFEVIRKPVEEMTQVN